MAFLESFSQFDINAVNLYWYSYNFDDSGLYDNSYVNLNGQIYEDLFYVDGYDGTEWLELVFLGSGIAQDLTGAVIAGTVNVVGEIDLFSDSLLWYIEGISTSAVAIYNAALTPSNQDEIAIIQAALTGNDTIILSPFDDRMYGFDGDDDIYGNGGNDTLDGGNGDDGLTGGAGNDTVNGGAGSDWAWYDDAAAGVTVNLTTGTARSTVGDVAGIGIDNLISIERVTGGNFADSLTGDALGNLLDGNGGDDWISGADGSDWLFGWDGNDQLFGGAGDDQLDGESGVDTLTGGTGLDHLEGGDGNDIFRDTAAGLSGDTLTDFGIGDTIVISDATLSSFTFNLSGMMLNYTGGSLTLGAPVNGTIVASAAPAGGVQLTIEPPQPFDDANLVLTAFGYSAGGWTSDDRYPRHLADVNGDGRADIVGFGNDGAFVALGNSNGTFAPSQVASTNFGAATGAGGWTSNNTYPRGLADVNGDSRADIVAFGEGGTYVSLGQANGTFGAAMVATGEFGRSTAAGGWTSNDRYPRELADVNGDGRADIVAFGEGGTYVALGQANGFFGPATVATGEFGAGPSAGGWTSNDRYLRVLADVNGDNRADIVGFGEGGTYVALANSNGTFAAAQVAGGEFGAGAGAGGWASNDLYPRQLADVNDDGKIDIVGFGNDGVFVALGNGDGTFQPSVLALGAFGAGAHAGGWSSQDIFPRQLADINNDGAADLIGFGASGVYVALSNPDYWM